MPLVALIFGTAALGSEIEDGTAVYLLIKPIPRWQIALAKILVAAGLTAAPRRPVDRPDRAPARRAASDRRRRSSASRVACLIGGSAYAVGVRDAQRCSRRGRSCSASPTS